MTTDVSFYLKKYKIDLLLNTGSIPINLSHIVGNSPIDGNMTKQGDVLEYATAASLWARYRLATANPGEFVQLSSIVSTWTDESCYVRIRFIYKF